MLTSPCVVQVLVALGEGQVEYLEIAEASLRQARDTAWPDPGFCSCAVQGCRGCIQRSQRPHRPELHHYALYISVQPPPAARQRLYDSRQAALLGPLMQQPQACCILATGHQGPHHESLPDASGPVQSSARSACMQAGRLKLPADVACLDCTPLGSSQKATLAAVGTWTMQLHLFLLPSLEPIAQVQNGVHQSSTLRI